VLVKAGCLLLILLVVLVQLSVAVVKHITMLMAIGMVVLAGDWLDCF
jgi:hypothetical protein